MDQLTKKKLLVSYSSLIILTADLFILYYLKYRNQGLQFSDIQLSNIGNLLNLSFFLLTAFGILIYSFRKKNSLQPAAIIYFIVIMNILLAGAAMLTFDVIPLPYIFVLGYPLPEVAEAGFYMGYQLIMFILLLVIWLSLLGRKELLLLRSTVDAVILVILLLLFAFYYLHKNKVDKRDTSLTASDSNIGVVLGAAVWSDNKPSPTLSSRIDRAVELYKKGIIGKIQLTGSNAPGELTEAEVAYNYVSKKNIDTADVWIETRTTSTSEQINFVKNKLLPLEKINGVIIISDSYHLTRVKEISTFFNFKPQVAASDLDLGFASNLYYKIRESVALVIFWLFAL